MIDLAATVEEARADPAVHGLFAFGGSPAAVLQRLKEGARPMWQVIRRLSTLYKHGDEDLRRLHDDELYVAEIADRLRGAITPTVEELAAYCGPYLATPHPGGADGIAAEIRDKRPELYTLLAAQAQDDGVEPVDLVRQLQQIDQSNQYWDALLKRYPRLCRTLAVARQEQLMREDGHQLVCRWQRQVAPLISAVGERAAARGVLSAAEQVFDLHPLEFIALAQDDTAPTYLADTPRRLRTLEKVETRLEQRWGRFAQDQRPKVVRAYELDLRPVFALLQRQQQAAELAESPELAAYYQECALKLRIRARQLSDQGSCPIHIYQAAV